MPSQAGSTGLNKLKFSRIQPLYLLVTVFLQVKYEH